MGNVLFVLSELNDGDIDWLIANGRKLSLPAGTTLIEEGKPIDAIYISLDGRLRVTIEGLGPSGSSTVKSGEILGELSFLDERPPTASISALDDATVLSIPRARLAQKLEQEEGFAARFYRAMAIFLASRLRRTGIRLSSGSEQALDETVEYEEELAPSVLDSITLAGARFDWMLKRLRGETGMAPPPADGRFPGGTH